MKLKRLLPLTVVEIPGRGWLVREWGRYFDSAIAASRAIHKNPPVNSIQIIEWEPRTRGGSLAVNAITNTGEN